MMQEHEVLKRQWQHICLDIGKSMGAAFQVANVQGLDQDADPGWPRQGCR